MQNKAILLSNDDSKNREAVKRLMTKKRKYATVKVMRRDGAFFLISIGQENCNL